MMGPSPHGEGGLKFIIGPEGDHQLFSPSPYGEGGLKYSMQTLAHPLPASLPPRGGWIEIPRWSR